MWRCRPTRARWRSAVCAAALLGAPLLALTGCAPRSAERPETPRAIVIVSIDTLRSDHVSAYRGHAVATPHIDRLAREGVLFERAYTPVPLTLPAHVSLLSGLLPHQHGVRDNAGFSVGAAVPLLAEELRALGFATAAGVSSFVLRGATGLARGFDLYEETLPATRRATLAEVARPGSETWRSVVPWLEQHAAAGARFALFLHLFEPHTPYGAGGYAGDVAAADAVVGLVLDWLDQRGLARSTLVVLASDHGEGLGEHGEAEHGLLLHRSTLQVPLLLRWPAGLPAGQRASRPVSLVEVAGTVRALAAGDRARAPLLAEPAPSLALFAETLYPRLRFGWREQLSVIEGRHHLVVGNAARLFDLLDDPGELRDRAGEQRERAAALLARVPPAARTVPSAGNIDAATAAGLAALGYATAAASVGAASDLPEPASQLHLVDALRGAIAALHRGDAAAAAGALERLVAQSPRMLDALELLGLAREELGETQRAVGAYQRALALGASPAIAGRLARLLLALGEPAAALTASAAAAAYDPGDLFLRLQHTQALLAAGELDSARDSAREGTRLFPREADAFYQLGVVEMRRDERAAAHASLERALALAPRHLAALSDLAVLLAVSGRFTEADRLFERALALRPDDRALAANRAAARDASRDPGR